MGAQREGDRRGTGGAGDWVLGETLGRGGIGVVYAATHAVTGQRGALKVAHPEAGAVGDHWFRRERDLIARLRHPHIVALLDAGELEGERPYLVFERVDGCTLEEAAERLTLDEIVAIGGQLLDALGYAHDAGVVHCDVTPANVLLEEGPDHAKVTCVARLTDFGLARAKIDAHARLRSSMQVSGTPGYMSPEQAKGAGSPGPASDLFSCGALLFRLLTGYAPYGGKTAIEVVQHTLGASPLPLRPRQGLRAPVKLAEVVQRLLARDPEDRFPSAARARAAWLAAAGGTTPATGTVRPHAPRTAGLQSLETILVDRVRSTRQAAVSTLRETPAAGLRRDGLPWRRPREELYGRDAERAELVRALPPWGAEPSLVAICGERGVGKSALLEAVCSEARGSGARVLRAHGRLAGPCPPMEVLATIALTSIGAGLVYPARLAAERLARELADGALSDPAGATDALVGGLLGVGPRGGGPTAVMEAYEGFTHLLGVDHRPVVIVIDDAQGLDAGTWEVLRAVALEHPGHVGVVWCGAGEPPEDVTARAELERPGEEVLDAIWRRDAPEGARRDPSLTLPADVAALAHLATTHGATVHLTKGGWTPRFDAVVAALKSPERLILEAAAVYGDDIPRRGLPKVAQVLGAPLDEAHAALDALLTRGALSEVGEAAARLERWLRFDSPGLRAAALAGCSPEWRRHLHAVAAQWLARDCLDDHAPNRARVAHLALEAGLERSAAHALTEVGRLELEAGRPERAGASLDRAAEIAQGADADAIDQARVGAHRAEVALAVGLPVRCVELADEALRVIEPGREVLTARLRGMRAEALAQQGQLEPAARALEEAIEALGPEGDPMESARLHASLGWILGYRLGRNAEGIEHGRRALEVAARIHAPAFRASLCGRLGANYLRAGDWDGQLETNREDLRLSTRARDPRGIVRANINLGVCFHNRGALALADEHTRRALDLATRCGSDGAAQIAHNNLAMIALDDGRDEDAARHVDAVLEASARSGYRRALPETWITQARLHIRAGALDAADEALGRAEEAGDVSDLEMVLRTRALLELARGDGGAGRARMEGVCAGPEHDPYERALSRVTLAAVCRALGDADAAAEQEGRADAILEQLGADPAVERRRWGGA